MNRFFRPVLSSLLCLGFVLQATPAGAQSQPFMVQETFTGATAASDWTLYNDAVLTASPSINIDPVGQGWLRLTGLTANWASLSGDLHPGQGQAMDSSSFPAASTQIVLKFSYVSWGGNGADGISVFLYDPTVSNPMSGSQAGGGLGYCQGAGGYLAIGLDEYGNFSTANNGCTGGSGAGGGLGQQAPEHLVIRGPISANNYYVTGTAVPGGIDNPYVTTRPSPKTVLLTLIPAVAPAVGYTITAQIQTAAGQPWQTLFSNVPFSYAPPANLAVGFAASIGGSNNIHELQGLKVSTPDDLAVTMTGPATILQGATATYVVTLTNDGSYAIDSTDNTYSTDVPTLTDTLPSQLTNITWTCTGAGGATCGASGSGSLSTSDLTLPVNGSVTYTITGTLNPATTCGSTVTNSVNADFSGSSNFTDPSPANNTASVGSTVTCVLTLVANPASLSYSAQPVGTSSAAQAITVTGLNGTTISNIAASGDYSQTNNCTAALTSGTSCTINVVFTPAAEGTRSGNLTINSNAASSPTTVTLSGTGTNAVPDGFSFTPVTNVAPGSLQVSNSITVAGTNTASTISVSSGAEYSINGGAFTSVPGTVSPGAQVQVEIAASQTYGATVTAVLTIQGVQSTFAVTTTTTDTVPAAFSFTPATNVPVGSVQVSNPITVTGTNAASPISVSSGAEYSVNGGAFTSTPGTVQPGAQVQVEVTAPQAYGATANAVLTIGGVQSTFTVTTTTTDTVPAAFSFTPVTNVTPGSVQVSNPITVTGTNAASPISVSSGAEYSINGGPFTSSPGTVPVGAQVQVEITAPQAYGATATAVLTIGGVESKFTVTTAAESKLSVTSSGGGAFGAWDLLILVGMLLVRLVGPRLAARRLLQSVGLLGMTVVMLLGSSPSRAQAAGTADDILGRIYVGVRAGEASADSSAIDLTNRLRAGGYDLTATDYSKTGATGTLYAGCDVWRNLGVELGLTYLGRVHAELQGVAPADPGPLLHAATRVMRGGGYGLSLAAHYRWDLVPRVALDLRAGPYLWDTHSDLSVGAAGTVHVSQGGLGYTVGLGPRYALTDRIGLGFSADYFGATSYNHFLTLAATFEYHLR